MQALQVRTDPLLVTERRILAAVLATAFAAYIVRDKKGCANTAVLNQIASGGIADGVFSQFDDLNVVCKISEGRKDRHPRLEEDILLTRPLPNAPTAHAAIDPAEGEGQFAKVGRRDRASMVVFTIAPEDSFAEANSEFRVRYICLPPGAPVGPDGIGLDTEPSRVVPLICEAFGCEIEDIVVTLLYRTWTKELIAAWEATGVTVKCIMAGDVQEHLRVAQPREEGGLVYIVSGVGGLTEAFAVVPLFKWSGATIEVQEVPTGMEAKLDQLQMPILDRDMIIASEDCLLVIAGLSDADGLDKGAVPGIRKCLASGTVWVSVFVASPMIDRPRQYVVEYDDAGTPTVTLLGPEETLNEFLLLRYLRAGNSIETRFDESTGQTYFQQWGGCFVPGLESLTEAELIDLLYTLRSRDLIDSTDTVTTWDTNQYDLAWTSR